MKSVLKKNNLGEINQYNAEQINIINTVKGDYQNGSFFVGFCDAMREIASNKNLKHLDIKLLTLIFGYMGDKKMMIEPNIQRLMGGADYALELGYTKSSKSNITKAFDRLEEEGYLLRDKKTRNLHITINPAMATNTGTKNFTRVWNQSAIEFGNAERKEKEKNYEGEQDWDSNLIDQIHEKKKLK